MQMKLFSHVQAILMQLKSLITLQHDYYF